MLTAITKEECTNVNCNI